MYPATLTRDSRIVRRCRLRMPSGAPAHTLASTIEEALRLCVLPGEDQGRVYYFKNIRIPRLPANGDRRIWLDNFQSVLLAEANRAVHGGTFSAPDTNAVYFQSELEACTTLLSRTTRRDRTEEWFWPHVSGSGPTPSAVTQAADTINKLSRSEASWLAVAAVVFALEDPVPLLDAITEMQARKWLQELQTESSTLTTALPAKIPDRTARTLRHVMTVFAEEDPQLLWLAALGIISVSPTEMQSGRVVSIARATLLALRSGKQEAPQAFKSQVLQFQYPGHRPIPVPAFRERSGPPTLPSSAGALPLLLPPLEVSTPNPVQSARQDECSSQPTHAAGLYFLLNALTHLHLLPRRCGPQVLAEFFQRVAQLTHTDPDDPVLLWTQVTLVEAGPRRVDQRVLDAWLRKVQKWCWKNGDITLAQVVRRPGTVTLTRTHLDIAMSFDQIDVRVRRLGLDLDPGWLPTFGRVVHFHYRRGDVHD